MEILINACLKKGEVVEPNKEGVLVVDTGALPISTFDGLTNPDEIYKKSIENGMVDHHTIDMLPVMGKQPKKCATQMVVDYFDDILKYCREHNVKEIQIHQDADMDAITAAYFLREGLQNGKLPKCAEQMAEIVNKVDYAQYRRPVDEYVTSFPGCIEAIYGASSGEKAADIKSRQAWGEFAGLDNKVLEEVLPVYDALAERMEKDSSFDLDKMDIRAFIGESSQIDDKVKDYMGKGLEQTAQAQKQFEQDIANAKVVKFNFTNPETDRVEEGQMVIVSSKDPLTTTNLGYAHYGKNTIMAVYGGVDRVSGDMYDIGIAPEAASTLGGVMKDICITMNRNEASKRQQVEAICEGLEQLPIRTPKEEQRLLGFRKSLDELASMGTRQAFSGAEELGLIDKDPSPLVAGNTLVPASRHSLITKDTFDKALTNWASKTRVNIMALYNSIQR